MCCFDVPRALKSANTTVDPLSFLEITSDVISAVAAHQGIEFKPGDIMLIRTGWLKAYSALGPEARSELVDGGCLAGAGLVGRFDSCVPVGPSDRCRRERHSGLRGAAWRTELQLDLHKALIARLGMPIGENWDLASLPPRIVRGTAATSSSSPPHPSTSRVAQGPTPRNRFWRSNNPRRGGVPPLPRLSSPGLLRDAP